MAEYIEPIFDDLTPFQSSFGGEGYITVASIVGDTPERRVTMRIDLSEEERFAIAAGADIMLTLLTFGHPLQPSLVWVAARGTSDETVREIVGVSKEAYEAREG